MRLDGYAERYPSQLSGGQRQRMALARALAVAPRVLLLDEPFGALDAQVRKELRSWLRDLVEEMKVTTVLVTHDQEEAMEVADQIAIIRDGNLEQVGTPAACYDHPANEFVATFLGPATLHDGDWVRPHDLVIALPAPPSDGALAGRDRAHHAARLRGARRDPPRRRIRHLRPTRPSQLRRASPRPSAIVSLWRWRRPSRSAGASDDAETP